MTDKRQVTSTSSAANTLPISGIKQTQEKHSTGNPRVLATPKTSSTVPVAKSKTLDLTGTYVSILSSNPTDQAQRSIINESAQLVAQDPTDLDLQNSSSVWKHAMDLAGAGRTEEAAKFFRIHEALSLARKANDSVAEQSGATTGEIEVQSSQTTLAQSDEIFSEGGITFIPGAVTTHMDIGFTPYFNKNLRELKGPLPLTIFNRQWQELANSYHVEKRVKVENLAKDISTYTGYPYPHEMTQSYATWNTNYRNFVRTLRDVYNFKRFATWAEAHQANVEFYHNRDNWMTAFCYDIKVRLNAFAFRVSQNGTSAPPDISQRREDIAAICFAETRKLDEGSFEDNPYAKGGVKFGFDWTTGLPRSSNNHVGQSSSSSSASYETNSHGYSPNQLHSGSKRPHRQSGGGRQRGGYQGSNYDPNHAAKKQANSKGTPAPAAT